MLCRTVEEFENNINLDSDKIDGKIIEIMQVYLDIKQPQIQDIRKFYIVLAAKINSDYLVCLKQIHVETIYPAFDDYGLSNYKIKEIASMLEKEETILKDRFTNLKFSVRDRIDRSILKELNLKLFVDSANS